MLYQSLTATFGDMIQLISYNIDKEFIYRMKNQREDCHTLDFVKKI